MDSMYESTEEMEKLKRLRAHCNELVRDQAAGNWTVLNPTFQEGKNLTGHNLLELLDVYIYYDGKYPGMEDI